MSSDDINAYEHFGGHRLVYGQTGAGKSSYLKYVIADQAARRAIPIIIYDPFLDSGWPEEAKIYRDPSKFFEAVWKRRNCLVIHDEAGDGAKRNVPLERLSIQSRHMGHCCVFAAQRPQQIATTIRGQCTDLITFHLVPKDAEFLSEEFGLPELENASRLQPLQYFVCTRWGDIYQSLIIFPENQ